MHLWLTCYFARQRGRGGSATDGSPSMLSEGYLIAGPPKPRKKKKNRDSCSRVVARRAPRVRVEHRRNNASGRCAQVPWEGCAVATVMSRKWPNPKLCTSS